MSNKKRAVFIGRWQPFHLGHEWLIKNKLDKGIPVLIMVRDVTPDDANPLPAETSAAIIEKAYENDDVEVIIIPDIESVNWGRGVGYEVNEFEPPPSIYNISATQIRKEISEGSESWKEKVNPKIHDIVEKSLVSINKLKTYRFYKEGKRWFVDLPEWTGAKADLEMIAGADTMLDIISNNGAEVKLNISLSEYPGSTELKMLREGEDEGGGYYLMESYEEYQNTSLNLELWLCDVTKFVFDGPMPERIFIRKTL